MVATHHSEYLKLKSLLLKKVEAAFYSADQVERQWEALHFLEKPDFELAKREYHVFEEYLQNESIQIDYFPYDANVTLDSLYCRDASIATDFGVILCNMGKSGRINEPSAQRKLYQTLDLPILGEIQSPGTLEGGDVAWLNQTTLAVGHTYRTNESGIQQLKELLEPKGIEIIVAELPHYKGTSDVFHLMSILSPVDKDLAVVYSPLMPIKFRNQLIQLGFHFIEVPDSEFESMGCNVLATSPRKCMVVDGNPQTKAKLIAAGCEVFSYEGKHISVLGGGGPTCLTRPLLRNY